MKHPVDSHSDRLPRPPGRSGARSSSRQRLALWCLAAGVALVAACSGGSGGGETALPPEVTEYGATTSTRLAFEVRGAAGTTQSFALEAAPEGMMIDARTGAVEWVPQPHQIGEHTVTTTVTDAAGTAVTKSYRIQVNAPEGLPAYMVLRTDAVAYAPGQSVRVTWRLGGDLPPNASIELAAHAPAVDPAAPEGSATNWTLAPDGSWSVSAVTLQAATRSGQASLTLPNRVNGHWRIVAKLLDADGQPLAAAAARALVAEAPALRLTLNRSAAKPLDTVAAEVDVATGTGVTPARLVAWLVHPDGRRVGLPHLDPQNLEVAAGDSIAGHYPLLDRAFSGDEAGVYRIHARLYATADGRLLQETSARFTVCDSSSVVSGRVTRPDRSALDGDAVPLALVVASSLDSGGSAGEIASVSSRGEYSLTLGPGRYLLRAKALDAGLARLESDATSLTVECSAGAQSRDLALIARAPV